MTRVIRTAIAVCLLALAVACDDSPTQPSDETARFAAQLSPANEVPPVLNTEQTGSGTVSVTFKISRDGTGAISNVTADFQVNLAGFPAGTALIMAHIHRGAVGTNGNIVVDTGLGAGQVTLANGTGSFTRTGIALTPALMQEILATPSVFYFNVHSVLNQNGMARGQLVRE